MMPEAPPEERPLPVVMAGDVPLTFDWSPVRWRRTRLLMWLGVAAVGHVLVFYLFQVVSDSPPRQAPPVRETLILSRTQDKARSILEAMEDRSPGQGGIMPPVEREDAALAQLVKGYVPTWQDHRPALKPLPGLGVGGPLPPLMGGAAGLLPPLPGEAERARQASLLQPRPGEIPGALESPIKKPVERALPVLGFQSGLTGRVLVKGPDWPVAVMADEWPEEGPGSFLLSVSPAGEVTSCLSLAASAGLDEEVLRSVLMKLKFAPLESSSGDVQWGWVDVLW